jgi:hypothetical protein
MVNARVGRQVEDGAREPPVTLLEYLPIRRGSGGPQKPSSWLSEDVKGVFTVSTESSEIACVLHLKITNVVLTEAYPWV